MQLRGSWIHTAHWSHWQN